jgi:two-component system nitrogen regulation sensor histidine kinase NtrY
MKGFLQKKGLLLLLLISASATAIMALLAPSSPEAHARRCSALAEKRLHLLKTATDGEISIDAEYLHDLFTEKGIGVYEYRNNRLTYWNNSQIPVPLTYHDKLNNTFTELRTGYYLTKMHQDGSVKRLAICPLKYKFELQNNYLKNEFADWLDLPAELRLETTEGSGFPVTVNSKIIFRISGEESEYYTRNYLTTLSVLFFITIFFTLMLSLLAIKRKPYAPLTYASLMLIPLLRFLMLYLKWPGFLYHGTLYNLRIFGDAGSFYNSYLGDVLLNSFLLLWLAVALYSYFKSAAAQTAKIILGGAALLLLIVLLSFHSALHNSIVTNSVLSFDFLNLFELSWPSYMALIPVVLLNLSLFIILYTLCRYGPTFRSGRYIPYSLFVVLAGVISLLINPHLFWVERWWFYGLGLLVAMGFASQLNKNILSIGFILFYLTLSSAAILNFYIQKNQMKDYELFSDKLNERQDPVLENEFISLPAKIEKNEQLKNLSQFIDFNGDKEFLQLLKQNFFFGYFDRYNLEFALFDENCTPLIKNTKPILMNEGFFEEQIRAQTTETASPHLFFIEQYKNNSRYIARVPVGKNKLYILMEPKFFEEVGAFPDLLIDESQQRLHKFRNISYAVYRSGLNNTMSGDYNYPVNIGDSTKFSEPNNLYTHYFFHPDENTTVVVSPRAKNLRYYFTFNSYLFLFFSVLTYLAYTLYRFVFESTIISKSFTRRIQTTIILLLLVSITAVGITSSKLVSDQFNRDNQKQLEEKSNTILSELSGLMQNSDTLSEVTKDLLDLTIKKYAYVFNSDVSVFNNDGSLYLTSQPSLYDLGLAAPLVNNHAFNVLKHDRQSSYCSSDKAGKLRYLSHYAPVYNNNKKLLGFLNLPYFGKQSELVNELSGIISTLLNVYVLLFIISILSGLVLSGYITLPLRILKQQMGNISLGAKNEPIQWQSDDEVGKLVEEYNVMIEKLEKSAGMLAKSEREMAWREMAKQVAHEIKNPLTPMKLNLQYLQHVIKNNPDDFEERFTKASSNIIEQIDTLANIATEFGNFAKLPNGEHEKINMADIIHATVDLFEKENHANIEVNLHRKDLFVMADKDQMLRVFNNLIKNALQATSETDQPTITIISESTPKGFLVSIKDNGCGIAEELKPKLFTPNFTTKSTGSGLGLAMIKNICETIDARIWFESEEGKGAIFYVEFSDANV